MKKRVKDWRQEGYKIGDKLFMTSYTFWGEPKCTEVFISHIGKTVLKVKKNLDDEFDYSFSKGLCESNSLGTHYKLYKSKEEYNNLIAQIEYRKSLKEELKSLVDNIPNKDLEELIAKYK